MAQGKITISTEDATARVQAAFEASNVAPEVARSVACALIAAEVDGQGGHGLSRVASYAAQARSGKVDGHATPVATRAAPAIVTVDAGHGFAFPAIDLALDHLQQIAPETGIAAAYIHNSHHCGQLGAHVERLARAGLVGLMVANSPPAMAPWGGATPLFGTNPIAFAAPRGGGDPLIIDLSLSKVARGKVMAAAKTGQPIPEGWALDAAGAPTTDPNAALSGAMLPMGDAKGAALALIVEVLCATLTGANPSFQASSFFDADGAPPGVGQTLIAFSPAPVPGFPDRMETLLLAMLAQDGVRLPGATRKAVRDRACAQGVSVPVSIWQEIETLTVG